MQANALQEKSEAEVKTEPAEKDGSEEYDPESELFENGAVEGKRDHKALAAQLSVATDNITSDKDQVSILKPLKTPQTPQTPYERLEAHSLLYHKGAISRREVGT